MEGGLNIWRRGAVFAWLPEKVTPVIVTSLVCSIITGILSRTFTMLFLNTEFVSEKDVAWLGMELT